MRAIRFHRLGGPEVLGLEVAPAPELRPGGAIVRNAYMGVNFGDLLFLRGAYLVSPIFPATAGMEAAGTVTAVSDDVQGISPGDRVAYIAMGAFAEETAQPAQRLFKLPDAVGFEQGAALPIAGLTAYYMLHVIHALRPGQLVLVHAAAGGVGSAAVQIAKAAGARVIATVSNAQKAAAAYEAGADDVINYRECDFGDAVLELTGGRGADLVLDGVGKPTFLRGVQVLAPQGRLILFGRAGGEPDPVDPVLLMRRSTSISGFALPQLYRDQATLHKSVEAIMALACEGKLRMRLAAMFDLGSARAALEMLEAGQNIGKVLLESRG